MIVILNANAFVDIMEEDEEVEICLGVATWNVVFHSFGCMAYAISDEVVVVVG